MEKPDILSQNSTHRLIRNVTYFGCLLMSNMSPIALFLAMVLACVPLSSFGFWFLVVIEIGSLARFTCFSNVDLSCIFWSISNPFSRIRCFLYWCVFWVHYGTVSNSFHCIWGHSIVGTDKTSKVLFWHTFRVCHPRGGEDWYTSDQVHLVDIVFLLVLQSLV